MFCPIGLHRFSFVRASRDMPRRVFFDRIEVTPRGRWRFPSQSPPSIYDLRNRSSNNLPRSSIFDLRPRRSYNPLPSTIFGPDEWVEDRAEDGTGGVRLLRRWKGVLRILGGSSIFLVRRTKNFPPSTIFGTQRTKNPIRLPSSLPEEERSNLLLHPTALVRICS